MAGTVVLSGDSDTTGSTQVNVANAAATGENDNVLNVVADRADADISNTAATANLGTLEVSDVETIAIDVSETIDTDAASTPSKPGEVAQILTLDADSVETITLEGSGQLNLTTANTGDLTSVNASGWMTR